MNRAGKFWCAALLTTVLVAGCGSGGGGGGGGGGGVVSITTHTVTISWAQNHEKGVNQAGGGYLVTIGSQPTFTMPYSAPTTTTVALQTGTYTVSVRAFAKLDAQGGTSGSVSAPSSITVNVP